MAVSTSMQTVLRQLFQVDTLEEVPLADLQQLTAQHPFFAPGQFLLAKRLYQSGHDGFEPQLKKTALLFHNPLWLEHLLKLPPDDAAFKQEEKAWVVPAPDATTPAQVPVELADHANADTTSDFTPPPAAAPPEPLLKFILQTPVDPSEELEFTAFHTVDYFASQGILLQPAEQADKLGEQLKSFTQWLKVMRRPQQALARQLKPVNEEAIYQQASHSLEEHETVTETMAEVLVRQQNYAKAIQIYQKLGLQYPAKSAYFAAKIKALK